LVPLIDRLNVDATNLMSVGEQTSDKMTANKTAAACHQNLLTHA
jgi:hypothetical protein